MRVTGALWALDSSLAHRRHYPSINWHRSYTLYQDAINAWQREHIHPEWPEMRQRVAELLGKEAELQEVVQLVGPDSLQDSDRLILETSRLLRDGFLQQNAMDEVDANCPLFKQAGMLELLLGFHDKSREALSRKVYFDSILEIPEREDLLRLRYVADDEFDRNAEELREKLESSFAELEREGVHA